MKTTPSRKGCPNRKPVEKFTDIKGYVRIKCPDHPHKNQHGYVMEHRLVMEHHLGRYLTPIEVVHHKNKNTSDNRIENFQLFKTNAEHSKFHRPGGKCSICNERHFGRGFCVKHYNEWRANTGVLKTAKCQTCGKPLQGYYKYENRDGKRLCRKCRWPAFKCRICGKKGYALGLCHFHHHKKNWKRWAVPCSKCGKLVGKSGRNHWPPVCWKCKFPKRKCRICGGPHEAHGLCENHYKQMKRGTLNKQFPTTERVREAMRKPESN